MGKDKTKGKKTIKPTTATEAAALLGGTTATFGFGGVAVQLESQMNNELQLSFKKLNKKGGITRGKGLEELKVHFTKLEEKSEEEKAVISRWCALWPTLLGAYEYKNRILTLETMGILAKHLGRRMAPHLKLLLPGILCAHFDTNRSVQQTAQQLLLEVIPSHKHREAMVFCKNELLDFIKKNSGLTIQALSTPGSVPEEVLERYERLVSSSILALDLIITTLGPEENEITIPQYNEIFNDRFWKLFRSEYVLIRKAVYTLFQTLCKSTPQIVVSNIKDVSPLVLGIFSEKETQNHSIMWDTLLQFIRGYPNCWESVSDLDKQVFAPLWEFLKNGTYGSYEISYPTLLPYISVIPPTICNKKFYDSFFNHLWKGLDSDEKKSTLLIQTYMECLLFAIVKTRNTQENSDLPAQLFESHFLGLYKPFLIYEKILSSSLITSLANFLKQLTLKENCTDLVEKFWLQTRDLARSNIEFKDDDSVDKSKGSIFCSHLGLFLTEFKDYGNHHFIEVCKFIATSFKHSCNKALSYQIDLLVILTKLVPLQTLFGVEVDSLYEQYAIKASMKHSLVSKEQLDLNGELLDSLFSLLEPYFKENNDTVINNWKTLLVPFKNTHPTVTSKLLQKLFVKDHVHLHIDTLDELVDNISNALVNNYDSVTMDNITLFTFLISGNDFKGSPLVKDSTLNQTISYLDAVVTSMIDKSKQFDLSTSFEVVKALALNIQKISKAILAIVLSPYLAKKEKFSNQRHHLLLTVWKGLTTNIEESIVGKEFSNIWSNICSLLIRNEVTTKDEFYHEFLSPLIYELWADVQKQTSSEIFLVSRASKIFQLLKQIGHNESQAVNYLFEPIEGISSIGKISQVMLDVLDTDPLVTYVNSNSKQPSSDESLAFLVDYSSYFHMAALILIHEFSSKALIPEKFFSENNSLVKQLIFSKFLSVWDIRKDIEKKASLVNLGNNWKKFQSWIQELNKEYIKPTLKKSTDLTILNELFESAINDDYISSALFKITLGYYTQIRNEWFKSTLLTTNKLFSLQPNLFHSVITTVTSHNLSLSEQLVRDASSTLVNLGKESSTTPAEIEKPMNHWCEIVESIPKSILKDKQPILLELLGYLVSSNVLPKVPDSMRPVLSNFASILIRNFSSSLPDVNHNIWSQLWLLVLSNIKDKFFTQNSRWSSVKQSLKLTHVLLKLSENESFTTSKYETVIIDGEIVKGNVIDSKSSSIPWLSQKDEALKIIARHYFTVTPQTYSKGQYNIASSLAKCASYCNDTIVSNIEQHNDILYSQLRIKNHNVKLTAYELIRQLIDKYNESSNYNSATSIQIDENETISIFPQKLQSIIENVPATNLIANEPNVDEDTTYLLGWALLSEYFYSESLKVRTDLGSYVRKKNLITPVMSIILKYLSVDIHPPSFIDSNSKIADISSFVFRKFIKFLPSMVRVWLGMQSNRSITKRIEEYTTIHISPYLIEEEMKIIVDYNSKRTPSGNTTVDRVSNLTVDDGSFSVKLFKSGSYFNEIQASYTKDEVEATIVLVLSESHPLKAVTVNAKHRIGVNEATWRKWILSMTTLLLTQDGSVLDAVLLWKESLDKYFEGVELCPICYALFHSSNHSVPNMSCKTCRSKFHAACLYKWFNTSHKSECPICKSLFN